MIMADAINPPIKDKKNGNIRHLTYSQHQLTPHHAPQHDNS